MTERQWLECTDPTPMLEFLRGKASERKLRLFAVACCRRVWHLLKDERSQAAVKVAERFAEGQFTPAELEAASNAAAEAEAERAVIAQSEACEGVWAAAYAALWVATPEAAKLKAALWAAWAEADTLKVSYWAPEAAGAIKAASAKQATLLRDIIDNPFAPVVVNPALLTWQGGTIPTLAQAIYDELCFQDLPILADALEEAGCVDADILNHCRQPAEHVRGCWVVDLILGKT